MSIDEINLADRWPWIHHMDIHHMRMTAMHSADAHNHFGDSDAHFITKTRGGRASGDEKSQTWKPRDACAKENDGGDARGHAFM